MPPGNAPEHLPKFTVCPVKNGFATAFMNPMNQSSCFKSAKQMAQPPKTGIARNRTKTGRHSPPKTRTPETTHQAAKTPGRAVYARLAAIPPHQDDPHTKPQPPRRRQSPKTRHGPQSNKNRPPFNAKLENVQSMHPACQIARKGHLCSILPHS